MKLILVLNLIGSLIHQSEAYKPVVVIHGLKEKVSDLDFLKDIITKVIFKLRFFNSDFVCGVIWGHL